MAFVRRGRQTTWGGNEIVWLKVMPAVADGSLRKLEVAHVYLKAVEKVLIKARMRAGRASSPVTVQARSKQSGN